MDATAEWDFHLLPSMAPHLGQSVAILGFDWIRWDFAGLEWIDWLQSRLRLH